MSKLYQEQDPWGWWRAAIKSPEKIGSPDLPVHEIPPGNGYYRVRRKGEDWQPVQIWFDDDGRFYATRNGASVKPDLIPSLWQYACRNPITEEAFDASLNGEGFPDEPQPAVKLSNADPLVGLNQEFEAEKLNAEGLLVVPLEDRELADQAAIVAKRLVAISNRADAHHKTEKEPSLTEGRRIDSKWRPLREDPAGLAKRLKRSIDAFLRAEDLKEQERQRAAEAEAKRLKEIADEALFRAEGANDPDVVADAGAALSQALQAEREAKPKPVSVGRTGERVSLRLFVNARIVDQDALYHAVKTDARVVDLLQTIADAAARANVPLPGTERVEERRAV